MADKPNRAPWEDEPYVDRANAAQKAIAAAQPRRGDPKSAVVVSWAGKAFDEETAKVRAAPEGQRQKTLFPAAANLYEIVAAGALDETTVYNALRDACRDNRLEQDDGEKSVEDTLRNARRKGFDNPRDLSNVGTKAGRTILLDDTSVETVELKDVLSLERGFWTSRESLQNIYLSALAQMCSPWAVLGNCAARALALVNPHVTLPPIIGGKGSLNWFVAIAAKSGGGKDSVMAVADHLVNRNVLTRNLGSGEGVIDAYVKPANKETGEPPGLHESVMFVADEIDTMATLSQRAGATLPSILRSAFSGGTLGFSYRTASSLHLAKHTYRMTLVVSVQPAKAGALMDDIYGGTLQRFMWFPASDSRITAERPTMGAPLELPSPNVWRFPTELKIPYEATELIVDERVRIVRGEADDIDGHALFIREKFAYALAVLDGRHEMTLEDWRLSGIASRVSDHTRAWVKSELMLAQESQAIDKGRLQGVTFNAADEERAYQRNKLLSRIALWAEKKMHENGGSMTQGDLTRRAKGRDRPYVAAALDKLEGTGRVKREGNRWIRVAVE
jgi:hypothetical protein